MRFFIPVMKALSDPDRVKIVKMLQQRELCVCELAAALRISPALVSSHLQVLEEAGLVRHQREGQWVNYLPADGDGNLYAAALLAELSSWLDGDPEIQALMAKLPSIRREEIRCENQD